MSEIEMEQQQKKELHTKLWKMANALRGNMDANEFKDYILGLIFFRYVCEHEESEFKEMLIAKMEETGVKSIDNDYFKITYVAPSQRETIDSARLKREHPDLAVEYTKTSLVKASVRITLKD